jgi:hypothetical protein
MRRLKREVTFANSGAGAVKTLESSPGVGPTSKMWVRLVNPNPEGSRHELGIAIVLSFSPRAGEHPNSFSFDKNRKRISRHRAGLHIIRGSDMRSSGPGRATNGGSSVARPDTNRKPLTPAETEPSLSSVPGVLASPLLKNSKALTKATGNHRTSDNPKPGAATARSSGIDSSAG